MGQIKLFDVDWRVNKRRKEFKELYNRNMSFFYNVNGWFFFANDKGKSNICWKTLTGNFLGDLGEYGDPRSGGSAFVGHFKSDKIDLIEELCSKNIDGRLYFKLKDGVTEAYVMILDMGDGEKEVGLVVKNDKRSLDLPFSRLGYCSYSEALSEEGSLADVVENDMMLWSFKEDDLNLLGLLDPKKMRDVDDDINL